jgi:hypothetical protein
MLNDLSPFTEICTIHAASGINIVDISFLHLFCKAPGILHAQDVADKPAFCFQAIPYDEEFFRKPGRKLQAYHYG